MHRFNSHDALRPSPHRRIFPCLLIGLIEGAGTSFSQVPTGYSGKPWHDSLQTLPGILQPANYDEGASGITWFDTGPQTGSYKARNSEVDLDHVKTTDSTVPGSTTNFVAGSIYWGWLDNGEWLKMTVDVKEAGTFAIHAMVGTAMNNTSFKVDALQGADSVSSGNLVLPFTGDCPLECFHYWYYAKSLGKIKLKAGVQVIRLKIVKSGYNINYVAFELEGPAGIKPRTLPPLSGRDAGADPEAGRGPRRGIFDAMGARKNGFAWVPVFRN